MTTSSTGVTRRTIDTPERRPPEADALADRIGSVLTGPWPGCAGAVRVGRAWWR